MRRLVLLLLLLAGVQGAFAELSTVTVDVTANTVSPQNPTVNSLVTDSVLIRIVSAGNKVRSDGAHAYLDSPRAVVLEGDSFKFSNRTYPVFGDAPLIVLKRCAGGNAKREDQILDSKGNTLPCPFYVLDEGQRRWTVHMNEGTLMIGAHACLPKPQQTQTDESGKKAITQESQPKPPEAGKKAEGPSGTAVTPEVKPERAPESQKAPPAGPPNPAQAEQRKEVAAEATSQAVPQPKHPEVAQDATSGTSGSEKRKPEPAPQCEPTEQLAEYAFALQVVERRYGLVWSAGISFIGVRDREYRLDPIPGDDQHLAVVRTGDGPVPYRLAAFVHYPRLDPLAKSLAFTFGAAASVPVQQLTAMGGLSYSIRTLPLADSGHVTVGVAFAPRNELFAEYRGRDSVPVGTAPGSLTTSRYYWGPFLAVSFSFLGGEPQFRGVFSGSKPATENKE